MSQRRRALFEIAARAPGGFAEHLLEYVAWMEAQRYNEDTIGQAEHAVMSLFAWCEERGVALVEEVTRLHLERYARHMSRLKKPSGEPLSFRTQYGYLSSLRGFFRFLVRRNVIVKSPANDLELPRLPKRLPRNVLSHEEVERVLLQPDVDKPSGVRDRAILETLYSTGLRRTEITKLDVLDLDLERKTVLVREGKHKRDRLVPIGDQALAWNVRYLDEVRPSFAADPEERALYLSEHGRLSADGLSHRVTKYVNAAELGRDGSCHLFRHTAATVMLERGADIRVLQEILGHTKLNSTQLYTHVSIGHLKQVHSETHPSAKRPERGVAGDDDPRSRADE